MEDCDECVLQKCTQCSFNFFLDENQKNCKPNCTYFIPFCSECDNKYTCSNCFDGYSLSSSNKTECFYCNQNPSLLGSHYDYCFEAVIEEIKQGDFPTETNVTITCRRAAASLVALSINESLLVSLKPKEILASLGNLNQRKREEGDANLLEYYRQIADNKSQNLFHFGDLRSNTTYYIRAFCFDEINLTQFSNRVVVKSWKTLENEFKPQISEHKNFFSGGRRRLKLCIVNKNQISHDKTCEE